MFNNNKRIIFLAPLSSISRRARLFKIANYINLNKPSLEIIHIGWERIEGESIETDLTYSVQKKIILKGGGYGGSKVKYFYFIWMFKSFISCLKLRKTDIVWALGFESAFPALIASKLIGFTVVFDDADRFSLLFSFPRPLKLIIEYFERITSRNSFIHLIPGIERYNFNSTRFHVLKNMPSKIEIDKAAQIYKNKTWPSAGLVVNINGFLHENRGLDVALELVRRLESFDIHFIVAGRLACREAEELILYDNVTYLGKVSNSEALASYFASDLVLTYFKPDSVINTVAESNKWGDAIKIGVGIIVNSEVKTAQYLREGSACISCPYHDIKILEKTIIDLVFDKTKINKLKQNSKNLADKFDYFEDQLRLIIEKI